METRLRRFTTVDQELVLISLIPQNPALHPSLIPGYKKSLNYNLEQKTDIVLNLKDWIYPLYNTWSGELGFTHPQSG